MDNFDELTRGIASGMSRRKMFKLGLGAVAALFVSSATGAFAKTCNGFIQPNGDCCQAPGKRDRWGYCCPFGSTLDDNGNCCSGEAIDKYGYCCTDPRGIDHTGACCDFSAMSSAGYCPET